MDDMISRRAAINVIERNRAYIGHNMERAVGAAFIEILDDVGEDIGRLPSVQLATDTNAGTKLSTNLAEVGTDCISRQAAIDALAKALNPHLVKFVRAKNAIEQLPSAQPEIIRCRNCKFASGDSRICIKFGYSPIGELDFCAWAERRTDE